VACLTGHRLDRWGNGVSNEYTWLTGGDVPRGLAQVEIGQLQRDGATGREWARPKRLAHERIRRWIFEKEVTAASQ
jgi:hypothetical protein